MDKDNKNLQVDYEERQPRIEHRIKSTPINQQFVLLAIFFVLVVCLGAAYRIMPVEMIRGVVDTLISISLLSSMVGLTVSAKLWLDSF